VLSLYNAIQLDGGENSSENRLLSIAEDLNKKFPTYSTGPSNSIDGQVLDVETEISPSIGKNQSVTMVKDTNELGYSNPDSLVTLNPSTVNTSYGQVLPTNRINVLSQLPSWITTSE
tara:strand:+ start:2987 stop:3337 length:351 start_codon:yes stop_codon:yes gene_type:complete